MKSILIFTNSIIYSSKIALKIESFLCCFLQEKVSALENQANQLGLQASQECDRLAKDRTLTLQMLQKVHTGTSSNSHRDRIESRF